MGAIPERIKLEESLQRQEMILQMHSGRGKAAVSHLDSGPEIPSSAPEPRGLVIWSVFA